ncbi:hypothetical protein F511_28183 [Dorcoceras hygrometricum]|uniref:Uncharacterized protein n=1 Tax=Dorcoceras hygrometricum TaxID=472368 RepID=A0A2Z7ADT9_9LAMI|nr:hypothetical protein F511_28183 [Dorcoceras hygrometricum]
MRRKAMHAAATNVAQPRNAMRDRRIIVRCRFDHRASSAHGQRETAGHRWRNVLRATAANGRTTCETFTRSGAQPSHNDLRVEQTTADHLPAIVCATVRGAVARDRPLVRQARMLTRAHMRAAGGVARRHVWRRRGQLATPFSSFFDSEN